MADNQGPQRVNRQMWPVGMVFLWLLFIPLVGWAQEPAAPGDATTPAPAAKVREWVQRGSQKVVEINFEESGADVIYGKVQKPGVDYLITQEELKYEGLPMEHDLVEVLERSARNRPF